MPSDSAPLDRLRAMGFDLDAVREAAQENQGAVGGAAYMATIFGPTELVLLLDAVTAMEAEVSRLTETLGRANRKLYPHDPEMGAGQGTPPLAAALESSEPPSPPEPEWDAVAVAAALRASMDPELRERLEAIEANAKDPNWSPAPSEPPSDPEPDCGHRCCSERSYKYHAHWLSPEECPHCAAEPKASE